VSYKAERKRRKVAGATLTARSKRIKARDGYRCQMCGAVHIPEDMEVDHITPIFRGGSEDDDNLQSLCKPCHEDKTASDMGYRIKPQIGADGWPIILSDGGGE